MAYPNSRKCRPQNAAPLNGFGAPLPGIESLLSKTKLSRAPPATSKYQEVRKAEYSSRRTQKPNPLRIDDNTTLVSKPYTPASSHACNDDDAASSFFLTEMSGPEEGTQKKSHPDLDPDSNPTPPPRTPQTSLYSCSSIHMTDPLLSYTAATTRRRSHLPAARMRSPTVAISPSISRFNAKRHVPSPNSRTGHYLPPKRSTDSDNNNNNNNSLARYRFIPPIKSTPPPSLPEPLAPPSLRRLPYPKTLTARKSTTTRLDTVSTAVLSNNAMLPRPAKTSTTTIRRRDARDIKRQPPVACHLPPITCQLTPISDTSRAVNCLISLPPLSIVPRVPVIQTAVDVNLLPELKGITILASKTDGIRRSATVLLIRTQPVETPREIRDLFQVAAIPRRYKLNRWIGPYKDRVPMIRVQLRRRLNSLWISASLKFSL